jgi:hypothetical protein
MAIVRPDSRALAEASVDTPPGPRRKREREDEDLPVLDDSDDETEPFDPGDDSDLGLDALEDENVGLDTSLGFDETSDDLDMPELSEDEDEAWEDDDESGDLPDAELEGERDDDEEDEYGWTGDDDATQDDDDFADDFDDEPEATGDDGGAEGLEDESEIDDLDLAELPALDEDTEEETGLPGLDGTDELAAYGLLDEPTIEVVPGVIWKMLRPRATRVTRVSWPADARAELLAAMADGRFARSLAVHAQSLYLAAGRLYRLDPQAEVFARLPLPAAGARQLVVAEHEGAVHVLSLAAGQLSLSSDAANSFVAQATPQLSHAGFTHSAAGLRLWWQSSAGELGSDVPGAPTARAIAGLHTDGRRSIAWVSRAGSEQLQLTASADGGKGFVTWPAPAAAQSLDIATLRIETCGDALLLSAAGQLWCGEHGKVLTAIPLGAREPATLIDEEGEPSVFSCVERGGEWLLVRRSARVDHAAPLVLATLGPKELGEPLALAVSYGEGGILSLFVACQEGVRRIEVSLDGEELA